MKPLFRLIILSTLALSASSAYSKDKPKDDSAKTEDVFSGLKLRSLGPAFMSGRISDIVINPADPNQWYVAVGSGNVWKTDNAGITWKPIFDDQGSFSIGCVTMDPSNPAVIWVGTGENVGGRHVAFGDGVYRSRDGGGSWENLGLKQSEHIAKILVHPENPDVVWVAAQGPLWSKGGERGLYKSADGGKNWKRVLGDSAWTGVTDLAMDPRDPDLLYAATWQRHRTVAAYMGGGPESGVHRSTDGGETWERLKGGLPGENMGKIGLAISPQQPDVIYAAIELKRRTGAVYRSTNRGASWQKGADAVAGGTGPHYYQEIYASPHKFDRLYLVDVFMQVSEDGGKTFTRMSETNKHVDNHAIAFQAHDPDYLLVGCDGGLYESFDLGENWRFIPNLPVTQFYKVAVDDAAPFYNIYGGTQDNATQGGPSRTTWARGIQNSDWWLTVGGDGHQPATEPGNPAIIYSESQNGYLSRVDVTTGEIVFIQPQPEAGDSFERFNWDSPVLVSPHSPTRVYFASHRVWRSDNRGDSWTAISSDLTRPQERLTLPIMGQTWSWDEVWDLRAMSTYNSITSLAESPLLEGLLYAGTDDGSIQVTEDGGAQWRRMDVSSLAGVPATAFVNDIKADLYDANTVYAALDNHKFGDFEPYLYKSTDRGKSWKSIRGDLPGRSMVWRLVQDHVKPELLFAGTEFGLYTTFDGGKHWHKLSGGVPTISFRDLAIQRRENDLVGATFGRGFYVLDDYSALRNVSDAQLASEATLFAPRKAWWYVERTTFDVQGANHYLAPNPPFGAVFTYHLKDALKTNQALRKAQEDSLKKEEKPVTFPGWEAVEAERRQDEPQIWLTIKDARGDVVRRVPGVNAKGFQRVAWDLRYPATDAITSEADATGGFTGAMAAPGEYTVTLAKQVDGVVTDLSQPMPFTVERLQEGALPGSDPAVTAGFWRELERFQKSITATREVLSEAIARANMLQKALARTQAVPGALESDLHRLRQSLADLDLQLSGSRSKREIGEDRPPTIADRHGVATESMNTTYGPTPTQERSLEIAAAEFQTLKQQLEQLVQTDMPKIEQAMQEAGAPWIKGQPIPEY